LRSIHILSLVQAYDSLDNDSYVKFLQFYGIEIRNEEAEDLQVLVNILCDLTNNLKIFDQFYVGYKIPQIGKEFDLLRFGSQSVINVELKRTSSEETILEQLVRNKYYLSYIEKDIYNLSFVSDTEQLYFLNQDDNLEKVCASFLLELLNAQEIQDVEVIDDLFNPSDYLVSPFNSTNKFIQNKYFLTHQQEYIRNITLNSFASAKGPNFVSIIGGAGTGKTLLVYDIVKCLRKEKKKTLIIHCGYLNSGQDKLIKTGWEIIPIKTYAKYDLSNYKAVFIDEAQRIKPEQLELIVEKIKLIGGNCIFSYDKVQTLSQTEANRDIDGKINSIKPLTSYKLSEKIRTNKEIATFIKMLFNKNRQLPLINNGNIEINYFNNIDDAKIYLASLDTNHWEVLHFTPSQYLNEHHEKYSASNKKTSHKVIGQEFDGVAVTIDQYFKYNKNNELIYRGGTYYHAAKMLFQNITRARKRLNLVIINNEELLNRCVYILKS
jgi:hypothetical protein